MLIEIFLIFQVLVFVMGALAYWRQHPILWALAAILAATLAVSAYSIEYRSIVVTNSTVITVGTTMETYFTYGDQVTQKMDVPLFGMNIGLFCMALVYFFVDLFREIQKNRV